VCVVKDYSLVVAVSVGTVECVCREGLQSGGGSECWHCGMCVS